MSFIAFRPDSSSATACSDWRRQKNLDNENREKAFATAFYDLLRRSSQNIQNRMGKKK